MAVSPVKAFSQSLVSSLSADDLIEVEKFEQGVDQALLDHFDGLAMSIQCKASPKLLGEVIRRYTIVGWTVKIDIVKPRPTDPETGTHILGQDPSFNFTLIPCWESPFIKEESISKNNIKSLIGV